MSRKQGIMWLMMSPFWVIEQRSYREDEIKGILQQTGRVKNASRRSLAFGGWVERFLEWDMTLRHLFTTILNTRMLDFCCSKEQKMERIWGGLDWTGRKSK